MIKKASSVVVMCCSFLLLGACDTSTDPVEGAVEASPADAPGASPQEVVPDVTPDQIVTYKSVGGVDLQAHIFNAKGEVSGDSAVLVFMHGGALRRGSPTQGYELADRFTAEGVAVVSFQYRLLEENAETIDQPVADAKSAIRWLRQNASDLGIDPDRIVMAGHSAGAYLSLTTGVVPTFNETGEDPEISSIPNALLLWSAIVAREDDPEQSVLPDGMQMDDFSAASYIRSGLPKARFIHGDSDPVASYEVAMEFEERYRAAGNESSFHLIEGADHFFQPADQREQVMTLISEFLSELGYSTNRVL